MARPVGADVDTKRMRASADQVMESSTRPEYSDGPVTESRSPGRGGPPRSKRVNSWYDSKVVEIIEVGNQLPF